MLHYYKIEDTRSTSLHRCQNDDTLLIQQTNTILSIAQEETQYRPIAYRMYLKTLAELKTALKKRKRPKICQPPEQIVISSYAVKF